MMDKLAYLLQEQKKLRQLMSKRPKYEGKTKQEILVYFAECLADESREIKDEFPWQWHKNERPVDLEKVKEEVVDCLHYWLELANELDMNEHEIVERYNAKHQENIDRQVNGGKDGRMDYVQTS